MFQAIGHTRRVLLESLLGAQVMHAWGAVAQGNAFDAKSQWAKFCRGHGDVSHDVS
jgi:hypothetical protein